jgi:hypothetical protein
VTLNDYRHSNLIYSDALLGSPDGDPFYALIMAAFRGADTKNQALLRHCWPDQIRELCIRYEAPGGMLPAELRQAEATAHIRARLAERQAPAGDDGPPAPAPT